MEEAGSDDKLLKAVSALGNDDVLVTDIEEVTTRWGGDALRKLLEFELEKISAYLNKNDDFCADNKMIWELGRAFLREKSEVLRKRLGKLEDSATLVT